VTREQAGFDQLAQRDPDPPGSDRGCEDREPVQLAGFPKRQNRCCAFFVSRKEITRICAFFGLVSPNSLRPVFEERFPECERNLQACGRALYPNQSHRRGFEVSVSYRSPNTHSRRITIYLIKVSDECSLGLLRPQTEYS